MNKLAITRLPSLEYGCSEALNTLCTNISFSGESIRTILFTSCPADEGKSFVVMNTARVMAKLGKKVTLIDTDLRRSKLARTFGFKYEEDAPKSGLAHYLAGIVDSNAICYKTDIDGLNIIPVGKTVSNPLPLFATDKLGKLIEELKQSNDYIFVDSAPIGVVIDSAQISKDCDGTLLLVKYNAVHRKELMEAKAQLEQGGCPILGVVLNQVEFNNFLNKNYYSYYSYRSYGYYGSGDKKK